MDVEEGKREVLDCATCTRPQPASCELCPVTTGDQPEPTPETEFLMNLWKRVKRYNVLPDPGGLLDQEERLMLQLDVISDHVEARKQDQQKAADRKAAQQQGARR